MVKKLMENTILDGAGGISADLNLKESEFLSPSASKDASLENPSKKIPVVKPPEFFILRKTFAFFD